MSEVQEYNQTLAALQELRKTYGGVIYDVTTKEGMASAKQARAEIKRLRVDLEAKRKEIKEPALRHCQLIDSEAKRITAELFMLEVPIDDVIKAEEIRKEAEKQAKIEAERKRVAAIQTRIDLFRNVAAKCPARSKEIFAIVEKVNAALIGEEYQEFLAEAVQAKTAALTTLHDLHAAAIQREEESERLAAERAELEQLRIEASERQRAEQQRLADEQKRVDAIKAEEERLRQEREAVARRERELIEERSRQQEVERARLGQQRLDLERQEQERQDAVRRAEEAEALRLQDQQATDKALSEQLAVAHKGTPTEEALAEILTLARETERYPNHAAVRATIALIAEVIVEASL